MANVKATDLIDFTRASKGHALAKVSYGEELVQNGTFDSDLSGWTAGSSWSWVSGKAYDGDTQAGPHAELKQSISVTSGKVYVVTFDVSGLSGGNPSVLWAGSTLVQITADGSYTEYVVASGSSQTLQFSGQNAIYYVDNVSVKEVLFNQPDGTLQLFEHPNNIPRIEYDADGNLLGLLIEEARTNLITYSQNILNASWTKVGMSSVSAGTDVVAAPDGTQTADTATENNSTSTHYLAVTTNAVSANWTLSAFIKKKDDGVQVQLRPIGMGSDIAWATFDPADGSLLYSGGTNLESTSTTDVGNGWYRVSITCNTALLGGDGGMIAFVDGGSGEFPSYTGQNRSFYIWGVQLEAGSFPTSYIKTQGSTVSRAADVASIDVDQFGYNQSEGTVFAEYNPFSVSGTARGVFELSSGTGDNKLHSRASVDKHWLVRSGAATQASIDLGSATEGQQNKIAGVYNLNDFAASLNGSAVTTDTSGSVPTGIQELIIGSFFDGSNLNGHIKSITYTPKRLSNAKLQELTS